MSGVAMELSASLPIQCGNAMNALDTYLPGYREAREHEVIRPFSLSLWRLDKATIEALRELAKSLAVNER